MGALLLWDAARQIQGGEGDTCVKLYLSCRGAPHLTSPPPQPPIEKNKDQKEKDVTDKDEKDKDKDEKDKDQEEKDVKDENEDEKPKRKPKVKRYGRSEYKNIKFPKPGERPDFSTSDLQ